MQRLARLALCSGVLLFSGRAFSSVQCAAFSPGGIFATAQVHDNRLTLSLPNLSGDHEMFLPVDPVRECKLSFSQDDKFVAVSLVKEKPAVNQVEVAIVSLANRSWVGNGAITPRFAQYPGGFVGTSHEVATFFVSGQLKQGASLALQVFTVDALSKQVRQAALRPLDANASALFANSFDVDHNRAWYRMSTGKCGVRAVNILGAETGTTAIQPGLIEECLQPLAIDFPAEQFAVMGWQLADKLSLTRVDLKAVQAQKAALPESSDQQLQLLDVSAHSPDGKIEVVGLRLLHRDRVGGLKEAGYALGVLQVDPWKYLATVPLPPGTDTVSALAVENRSGKATIELWSGRKWVLLQDIAAK